MLTIERVMTLVEDLLKLNLSMLGYLESELHAEDFAFSTLHCEVLVSD